MFTTARMLILIYLAASVMSADVLTIDDGEKADRAWEARTDGKIASCEVRTTFNHAKVGNGSILTISSRPRGSWCGIGRAINADWSSFSCLRFWVRMIGVQELTVRLTDTGNESFVTKVTAKTPGEWEYVVLPFARFERNKEHQPTGAATDNQLDLIKITDLYISAVGELNHRFWLDQVDLAISPEAEPLVSEPTPPDPARLIELEAPLVKKTTKLDIDARHIYGLLSQHLAGGVGEDVGEFADNAAWADLVRAAGLPLLRINARVDRLSRGGVYDTWLLEQDITELTAAGSQALVVIDGIPSSMAKGSRDNPTDTNAYADLVGAIVQKINVDAKLGVKFWQFWQDADLKERWTGTDQEFGALAAQVVERMKRVDPSITVFSGGLSRSTAVRAIGQHVASLDPVVDGIAWSAFALNKISDGSASEALDRTWGFERTFLHLADISRAIDRPLTGAVSLRVTADQRVYNPRLDSIFGPVYLASAINHLARQNAAVGLWQSATTQPLTGLISHQGKHRPLVSFMGRWNAIVRERPWYMIAADSGTAMVESLAAVSGDHFIIMMVNKDTNGGQHDVSVKYSGMKIATANVWTIGRGVEAGEDKPLPSGGAPFILPPTSVTIISGTLVEPLATPGKQPQVAGSGKTLLTVRHVDRANKTLYGDDKEGRAFIVMVGDQKPVSGKRAGKGEPAVERPFLPGQQLEITGKKQDSFIFAERCVVLGETASVPTTSDSGFNFAERTKGRPVMQVERLKSGVDADRFAETTGRPSMNFLGNQLKGVKELPQDSDFSAKVRLAWNDFAFFAVVVVQDDIVMTLDPGRWDRQDAVVLGFDMGIDSSPGRNDENDSEIVAWSKNNRGEGTTTMAMGNKKGDIFSGNKFNRKSNGENTYILTIPWQSLGFIPEVGRRFGFNIVITESDKEKSIGGFFEWAGGMSSVNIDAQDFSKFGIIELR